MRGRALSTTIVVSAIFAGSHVAFADARDPAAAEALFRDGRAAAQKGDWETACPKFRESDRLDPATGTVLNLADCEEHRGKIATAWQLYRQVIDTLPAGDDRTPVARQRIRGLEVRLPHLTIRLMGANPPGTKVVRDQVELSGASLGTALPVDPGKYSVTVTSPDRASTTTAVNITEGASTTIDVAIGAPVSGGADIAMPLSATSTRASSASSSARTTGWIAGGVGVAGLGVFAVAGALTLGEKRVVDANCDTTAKTCNQAGYDAAQSGRTLGIVTTTGLVVGALGTGIGAYLVLTSSHQEQATTTVSASVDPSGPGVQFLTHW